MLGGKGQEAGTTPPICNLPQACGPTVHQTCKENTYVNGLCFLFGPNLRQQPQSFPEKIRGRWLLSQNTDGQCERKVRTGMGAVSSLSGNLEV